MEKLHDAIKEHSDLEDANIIDAGVHGADAGFGGFTYDIDCIEFWDNNSALIQEFSQEEAEEFGHANWLELYSTFGRKDMLDSEDGYKVLGAWFVLEAVGRWLEDKQEA